MLNKAEKLRSSHTSVNYLFNEKESLIMKRIISFALAVICVLTVAVQAFSLNDTSERRSALIKAKPVSVGYEKLVDEFTVTTASNGMKYAYYNPVIDEDDDIRYPVVIYVHGLFHAWTDRTFRKSGLTYWACREMQDKFEEGGAHLIMPKIPEFSITMFQTGKVYGIINEYISEHLSNVDESQIYIMGGSAGGGLAWRLIIAHPERFAAAVILCSTKTPTASEVRTVTNIPIWEVSANTDPLVNIAGQTSTWNTICANSNVREKCRWSTFTGSVTLPDGSHPGLSHFLAKTIGYDFCLISSGNAISGMTTKTASGDSVSISYQNGIVSWLQKGNAVLEKRKEAVKAAEQATPEENYETAIPEYTEAPEFIAAGEDVQTDAVTVSQAQTETVAVDEEQCEDAEIPEELTETADISTELTETCSEFTEEPVGEADTVTAADEEPEALPEEYDDVAQADEIGGEAHPSAVTCGE